MPPRRRDCPIWKLSNHLADIHQLSGKERQHYLSKARSLSNQRESEEMSNRKRMRSESDDEMSTASSSDEGTSKETLSENRMRNESDDETSTAPDEDIFSSSGEEDVESSEEMNDSDQSEEEIEAHGEYYYTKQRWNFVQSTMKLYKVFKMVVLVKLTQRNKPFQKFYQTFERNWEIFIWIA